VPKFWRFHLKYVFSGLSWSRRPPRKSDAKIEWETQQAAPLDRPPHPAEARPACVSLCNRSVSSINACRNVNIAAPVRRKTAATFSAKTGFWPFSPQIRFRRLSIAVCCNSAARRIMRSSEWHFSSRLSWHNLADSPRNSFSAISLVLSTRISFLIVSICRSNARVWSWSSTSFAVAWMKRVSCR
jgi:hypothetical protein